MTFAEIDMFVMELDRSIAKMNNAVIELRKQAVGPALLNSSSQPQDVLDQLATMLTKADELANQAKLFTMYQVCYRSYISFTSHTRG